MKDYKKTAIKLFEKHDFAASMKYFSLAYENEKDAEILLMIDLCGLAEIDVLEALMFYDFFEIKKLSIVQYQQISYNFIKTSLNFYIFFINFLAIASKFLSPI